MAVEVCVTGKFCQSREKYGDRFVEPALQKSGLADTRAIPCISLAWA